MGVKRFLGYFGPERNPVSLTEKLRAAGGAFLGITLVALISSKLNQTGGPVIVASMGASAVLVFAVPHSPMARPWSLTLGHLLSALIGVSCALVIPETWVAAGSAVCLAILVMHLLRALHPPGGATALAAVINGANGTGYHFVLVPVALNVAILLSAALLINNLLRKDRYPAPGGSTKPLAAQSLTYQENGLAIGTSDLQAAIADFDMFLDIGEDDLHRLFRLAAAHAYHSESADFQCSRLMQPRPSTVEFATPLKEAWIQLSQPGIKALTVVDRAHRVIGIVTARDFLRHTPIGDHRQAGSRLRSLLTPTPGLYSSKPEVVGQVMTHAVKTVRADSHILTVAKPMAAQGLRQMPVVDEHRRLVGLVTQGDVLRALMHILNLRLADFRPNQSLEPERLAGSSGVARANHS
jgi:CBS domain-containing membrane protein